MKPSLHARNDWVERLAKAFLTKSQRRWVRWHRYKDEFRREFLKPTDIFLVGHPKSGNTWLAYMLAIILFKDRESQVTLSSVGNYIPFVHGQDLQIADWAELPEPRIFRNEAPIFADLYPRVIYLVRDPRAVLVSFYHMYQVMLDDRSTTLESFLDQYFATEGIFREWNRGLVRWDRQVLSWMSRAEDDERTLIIKYEDLVVDRRAELEKLIRFIGITSDREELDCAVERGSFQAMRINEEQYGAEAYRGELGQRGRFIRRGEIAGWQTELKPNLAREIEARLLPAMKAAGYLP